MKKILLIILSILPNYIDSCITNHINQGTSIKNIVLDIIKLEESYENSIIKEKAIDYLFIIAKNNYDTSYYKKVKSILLNKIDPEHIDKSMKVLRKASLDSLIDHETPNKCESKSDLIEDNENIDEIKSIATDIKAVEDLRKINSNKLYIILKELHSRDPQKSIKYLIDTIDDNCSIYQYTLAKYILNGETSYPDDLAFYLLEKSIESGNKKALLKLTEYIYHEYNKNMAKHLTKKSQNNDPISQYRLGVWLLESRRLPLDIDRAISLLEKSAKSKNLEAILELADFYFFYEHDSKQTANYLDMAIENEFSVKKHPRLLMRMNEMKYENTSHYISKAIKYLKEYSEKGDYKSLFELGRYYYKQKDYDKALKYLQQAAQNNHPIAKFTLGKLLLKMKDNINGKKWLIRSFHQGYYPAYQELINHLWNKKDFVRYLGIQKYINKLFNQY